MTARSLPSESPKIQSRDTMDCYPVKNFLLLGAPEKKLLLTYEPSKF